MIFIQLTPPDPIPSQTSFICELGSCSSSTVFQSPECLAQHQMGHCPHEGCTFFSMLPSTFEDHVVKFHLKNRHPPSTPGQRQSVDAQSSNNSHFKNQRTDDLEAAQGPSKGAQITKVKVPDANRVRLRDSSASASQGGLSICPILVLHPVPWVPPPRNPDFVPPNPGTLFEWFM